MKRSSVFARPEPIRFQWQPRDAQILTRVWQDRLLSSQQVQCIFFGSSQRCNQRLRVLYSQHLLDRHFLPCLPHFRGQTHASYSLGKFGVEVVAQKLGLEKLRVQRGRARFQQKLQSHSVYLSLAHIQALSQARIAFEQGLGQRLREWIPERLLEQEWDGKKLRPDGFLKWELGDKVFSAFLEIDMGTQSSRQIQAKVKRYLAFSQSPWPGLRFGTRWFRVIFVTRGEKRSPILKHLIQEQISSMFWITEDSKLAGDWLKKPMFLRVGKDREERFAL